MLNKKIILKIFQFLIAGGILAFLFSKIDSKNIELLISHSIPNYLLLAYFVLVCQILVASYRWLALLRIAGFSPPVWGCVGSFAVSSLVNTTLPGGIGGDIMRMWITAREGIPSSVAANSVVLDRILNLAGLGIFVMIVLLYCIFFMGEKLYHISMISLMFGIALLGIVAMLALIVPSFNYFKIKLPSLLSPIASLSRMMGMILQQPYKLLAFMGLILLGYLMQITSIMLLADGLRVSLSLRDIFIGIPIALLLSAVPITPGGWGIRESAMVVVLGQSHILPEAALGISILFGICSTVSSVPAAAWWILRKNFPTKPHIPVVGIEMSE